MSQGNKTDRYENVADPSDYSFVDPTGNFQGALDQFGGMAQFGREGMVGALDPNAAFDAFLGQSGGLANMAQGATAPLTQQLFGLAEDASQRGMETAAHQFNMQGAGRSGAEQAALGEAAARPFAQTAADIAGQQLGLTGNLWGQALSGAQGLQRTGAGLYGNVYGQGMQGMGQMAGQMGGMMAPQYEYEPTGWEKFSKGAGDVMGMGASAKIIFACLHPAAKVKTVKGKTKKVKALKPGTEILDGYGRACSVVGVVKYREKSSDGRFFKIATATGSAHMCDLHETIGGSTVRKNIRKGRVIDGVRIEGLKALRTPKYSYDIITSGSEDTYQLEGLPVKGMADRIINRNMEVS